MTNNNINVQTTDGVVAIAARELEGVLYQQVIVVNSPRETSATTSTTDVGLEAVEILPENPLRITAIWHNHSQDQLYVLCAPGDVGPDNFSQVLQQHSYMELPIRSEYTGPITAARPAGSLTTDPVMVTEYYIVEVL